MPVPLLHLHKGLYNSIYCQCRTVITLMYQPAPINLPNCDNIYVPTNMHLSSFIFNAASAALTTNFLWWITHPSSFWMLLLHWPPSINCLQQIHHGLEASTTPLQLKYTQYQQLLAVAILRPQQLAASSYFRPLLPQQLLEASIYFTVNSLYFV